MLDLLELARQGYTISPEILAGLGGDRGVETYVQRLKTLAYRPADQVRLRQDLISQWIDQFTSKPQMAEYVSVLHALKNVGDNRLTVERVYVDAVGDILYTFVGSDLKVEATFCTNALPFIHEYGVLTLHEDRLWFVHVDDETSEARQVFEITQEPGRAAQHQLGIDSLTSLAELLRSEDRQAMAGEFAVEDHGAETWGLLYTPWSSSAPEKALASAMQAIQETMSVAPALN
ncbi:hypothetical protein [Rhizobium sp. MHM7A]|uniref:hypothetical protein n=1 Tax=Rhizobium sp. MHM7A TaxID=2583233 RepID=UPI0011059220|nr:hypothetical protein [Rhizobium sp. MHM7A]TLX16350.1 hypothetical protein FFR93_03190 [Rhizobium sp. MHM7A]